MTEPDNLLSFDGRKITIFAHSNESLQLGGLSGVIRHLRWRDTQTSDIASQCVNARIDRDNQSVTYVYTKGYCVQPNSHCVNVEVQREHINSGYANTKPLGTDTSLVYESKIAWAGNKKRRRVVTATLIVGIRRATVSPRYASKRLGSV